MKSEAKVAALRARSYIERELNSNLSGNEDHYTDTLILLVNNMLCSKLHCQTGFSFILFPCKLSPCSACRGRKRGSNVDLDRMP